MKKLLIFSISLLTLLSCSNDNDKIENSISGSWKLFSIKQGVMDATNDCNTQSTMIFDARNTFKSDNKELNGSTCVSEVTSGSWSKTDADKFEILFTGTTTPLSVNLTNVNSFTLTETTSQTTRITIFRRQ